MMDDGAGRERERIEAKWDWAARSACDFRFDLDLRFKWNTQYWC